MIEAPFKETSTLTQATNPAPVRSQVYKGTFADGTMLAVKHLKNTQQVSCSSAILLSLILFDAKAFLLSLLGPLVTPSQLRGWERLLLRSMLASRWAL